LTRVEERLEYDSWLLGVKSVFTQHIATKIGIELGALVVADMNESDQGVILAFVYRAYLDIDSPKAISIEPVNSARARFKSTLES
jgi:hypothetical protein